MTGPTDDELQSWVAHIGKRQDEEVVPGVTVQQVAAFHATRPPPPGAEYEQGVQYGEAPNGRALQLHLFRRADRTERRPGVVFIHGGGWQSGHPYIHMRHAWHLAARGFVTASISYRLHPETRWPGFVQDAKCAVRWMRRHHHQLGLDPDLIAAAGGSAGGHIAAMMAVRPDQYNDSGGHHDERSDVAAAVLWYPATELRGMHQASTKELIGSGNHTAASPVAWVTSATPPIVTITGDADEVTTLADITAFHAELDRHGVDNRLVVYPGRNHAFDMMPSEWDGPCRDMTEFLEEKLH